MANFMTCGIYCIENKINGKKYIGQSIRIEHRLKKHYEQLNAGRHINKYLQRSWAKYGSDNFVSYVLTECLSGELKNEEIRVISELNTKQPFGYNATVGGEGLSGYTYSEAQKAEMSERTSGERNPFFGKKHSEETKNRLSKLRKGIPLSEETKSRIKKSHPRLSGTNHHSFGTHLSERHKEKLSVLFSGNKNSMWGKTHSEKAKKKMSDVNKGRSPSHTGTKRAGSSSSFYGVCYLESQGRYYSQIGVNGENILLGNYSDENIAARAYDNYVIQNDLERPLNFPNDKDGTELMFKNKRKGKMYSSSSKYYGVGYHKKTNKWQVIIRINGKKLYIGIYMEEVEAAKAYDDCVIGMKLDKPLNFPEGY